MLKNIWKIIFRILRNKYILTLLIFIIWLTIFDANNLIDRYRSLRKLDQLEKDKEYYLKKIDEDSRRMHQLKTDKRNLERFAREEYLMKKKDEDIFVIVKEE